MVHFVATNRWSRRDTPALMGLDGLGGSHRAPKLTAHRWPDSGEMGSDSQDYNKSLRHLANRTDERGTATLGTTIAFNHGTCICDNNPLGRSAPIEARLG
jgi:hypothetical protein